MSIFNKAADKPKKPKSKARRIIEWVLVGLFGVIFAFALAAQIDSMIHKDENYGQPLRFGVGVFVVQTDSMEPEYPVKSAIITYKKSAEDIVEAFDRGETVDITFIYAPAAAFIPDDTSLTYQTNVSGSGDLYGTPMTHRLREYHIDQSKAEGSGERYIFIVAGINDQSGEWKINQYQVFTEKYILGQVVYNSNVLGGVFGFIASPWGLFVLLLLPAFYLVISSVFDIFKALKEDEDGAGASPSGAGGELSEADRARLKQEMLTQMIAEKQAARQKAEAQKASENAIAVAPEPKEENPALAGISPEEKARLKAEMLKGMQKEGTAPTEAKPEPKKDDKLAGLSDADKARLKAEMLKNMKSEKPKEEPKKDDKLAGLSDEDKARLKAEMLRKMKEEKK